MLTLLFLTFHFIQPAAGAGKSPRNETFLNIINASSPNEDLVEISSGMNAADMVGLTTSFKLYRK